MRSSYHRLRPILTHALIRGLLTLLLAALFTAPEYLPTPVGDALAPARAQAQTITTDCAAQTDVPQAECKALLALYTATDGPNWLFYSGWGQDNNVCSWRGVACTAGSVTTLDLSYNGLTGSIPPQLGTLANLTFLSLYNNQLTGSIPPELGSLTNLDWLHLSINQLTGSIPPELGRLANLTFLSLSDNQLTGSIPPELANLNVSSLFLANNALDPNVTDAALLAWLDQERRFSDDWRNQRGASTPTATPTATPTTTDCAAQTAVPPAECEALLALYLATDGPNWFSNSGWGQNNAVCSWRGVTCTAGRVTSLELAGNQLTGSIPPELGSLTNLEQLDLWGNQLSGSIPPELGNLTKLTGLWLYNNQLTG
ncbi:MAG: hypothetical protein HC911_07455, partial [Chloroflexaceae bacterium]|nr:hypothetical protein [Chloroflexaceae bacterium]